MAQTKSIYIYGSGGHGKVVAEIAKLCGYKNIIFLDDKNGLKFSENLDKFDMIIAIGDNKTRANLQEKAQNFGFNVVSLIHPNAIISNSAVIKKGVVIMAAAVVNANAIIENGAIINTNAVVEHDCVVGEFSHLSPNVSVAGGVKVGEFSHLGIGSSVIQNIKIGKNSIIGAGAVVIKDIPQNSVAVGVPARVIKQNL
ncbi:UDP-N-acetylbacillosamine N-acetyltransferase [Campylobacter corcagiensis]|uniref:UDP-N-acetylbacillosamine N-acetyltransferase n=1 Tax=Campylobacter corcagiensis TaxID=1448857 RepID=A0A7M1LI60_9BACT|nr:UDP-N-acetylbacillosamine N-acetyltransferase [Campylobacter corcagiensis]QKF64183.1 UDP-4-amino-4,6-dideoxy-alpha-D-N-acetyl-D-glucosamine N-acetyltransferase [Campylobacter corcagiensis]QOQ88120.1 UDP-N-acetylbacillosamine N-acetyltransferase [Campylobacter corcagiensis]